ncbi:MAG: peptidoglycan-binding protein [Anaerolineae bacterium]
MGELFKGKIEVQEGSKQNQSVNFMFNPTQYVVTKTNSWTPEGGKGTNVPSWEFQGGQARTITLELFFDSFMPRPGVQTTDVRTDTNKLFAFMAVDSQLKGTESHMGRPPKCRLVWGQDSGYQFDCFITSCTVTYLLFNESGVPIRATASLSLAEEHDPDNRGGTNPTSRGEPGRRIWVVNEGDRLDWIAYREYGDATQWRRIADANHLEDPLAISPGMALAVPPL